MYHKQRRPFRQYLINDQLTDNRWIGLLSFTGIILFMMGLFVSSIEYLNKGLIGFGILFVLISLFGYLKIEWAPDIEVEKMNRRANLLARRIATNLTPDLLANHLGLGQHSNGGFKIPAVKCWVSDDLQSGKLFIENLGVTSKLDKESLKTDLSGAVLTGKAADLVVYDSYFEQDKVWLVVEFESVTVDHSFYVENHNYKPFVSKNSHSIKLNDRLEWDSLHLALTATSGSGKTKLIEYITSVAELQGWELSVNSAKADVLTRKYSGEHSGKSEIEDIVEVAEYYVSIMEQRLALIASNNVDSYVDTDLNDVLIVFDELLDFNSAISGDKGLKARWESALKRLAGKSRSAGFRLLISSQHGTVTGLVSTDIRVNFANVIMLGKSANVGTERMFMMPGYEIENAKYRKGEGLAYFPDSEYYSEPKRYKTPWIE